ncbi:response regulator transcription factor [Nocardia alni]|uniref:response regulator transcription factor n=1 Tax=Nocardia alni TaxID=2815723 RepID=UPI001C23E835|nr:response regulator transcription factor [Nocardia alni]
MRILVVEDDDGVADALHEALVMRGYDVVRTRRGADVLTTHRDFECVLLDLGLPDVDGMQLLRRLRTVSSIPVVVLTADSDERTVIRALRSGADDYIVKPPRMGELVARMETATTSHRGVSMSQSVDAIVVTDDVRVDLVSREVAVAGQSVPLTQKEFELVRVLTEHPGSAISRQQLMDRIWGDAFLAVSRSLDVHISGLRAKLNRPGLITTIRGYGYRWGPPGPIGSGE